MKKHLVLRYSAVLFFFWFPLGMIIPISILFMQSRGLTLSQCSLVMAVYSAAIIILELPSGTLADLWGRRRIYLLSQLFILASSTLMLFSRSLILLMLAQICGGISRALSSGSLEAWFVDEYQKQSPEGNLQKTLAATNTVTLFSLALGTLTGGLLPDWFASAPLSQSLGPFGLNLILNVALNTSGFLFVWFFIEGDSAKNSAGREAGLTQGFSGKAGALGTVFKQVLREPRRGRGIFLILLANLAWGFGISALEQLWQPRFRAILPPETGTWVFGLLSMGYFFAGMAGNLAAPGICRLFKQNYPRVLFLGRFFMGAYFFLLAGIRGPLLFSAVYLILFSHNGLGNSPQEALFHRLIPSPARATFLSVASLFIYIGSFPGVLAAGFLAESRSIPLAWIPAASVLTLSAFLFLLVRDDRPRGKINPAPGVRTEG
ncbi:MAG: MFS transporter [Spirochaetales bacterium]|jgi:MFS family permease|nr:MFS transporter [Spirochaetales bacterium]